MGVGRRAAHDRYGAGAGVSVRQALETHEIIFSSSRNRESGRDVFKSQGISSECSWGSLASMNEELMEEARA